MSDNAGVSREIGKSFSEKWFSDKKIFPDIYEDLVAKLKDVDHEVRCEPNIVNRSYLACKYVMDHYPKGSKILDMACGTGFITGALCTLGHDCDGFDISEIGVQRGKELAGMIDMNPDKIWVDDVSNIKKFKDSSYDVILAMGLFRYLTPDIHELIYKNIIRILKPGGRFIVVHQNLLFEMFALNDHSLIFWKKIIEDYSDGYPYFGDKDTLDVLKEDINVPKRKFDPHSVSKTIEVQAENPLTYPQAMKKYGYEVENIDYPLSHILPPFLEAKVDSGILNENKKKLFIRKTNDWRSMLTQFEFIAYLKKADE